MLVGAHFSGERLIVLVVVLALTLHNILLPKITK